MTTKQRESLALESQRSQNHTSRVIALFGEVLADIFPEQSVLGGAPFNVARHLQAFGMHPVMITRTGNDALREDLIREMLSRDMDTQGVQCDLVYPTGQVQVRVENDSHRFEILPDQAYDHINAGIARIMSMSIKPELVYFGTLAQRNMESRLALDKLLSASKCPRFLDINLRSPWYNKHTVKRSLLRSDIVKLNEEELDIIANLLKLDGKTRKDKALSLRKTYDLELLLVTCGPEGAWLLNQKEEIFRSVPTGLKNSLIDTVGAGDAFAAIFIIGLFNDWGAALTLKRANEFASALCTIRGGAPQSSDFYIPFKKDWGL